MSTEQDKLTEVFGECVYTYTRSQAIADGVLIDVSKLAKEAGIRHPVAVTEAVWAEYVAVPEELNGWQDETGRLWDLVWMLSMAVRSGRITGEEVCLN